MTNHEKFHALKDALQLRLDGIPDNYSHLTDAHLKEAIKLYEKRAGKDPKTDSQSFMGAHYE